MNINLPKFNFPFRNIATVSLGAIALSTVLGLVVMSDVDTDDYTPAQWALAITGSLSASGWIILYLDRSIDAELTLVDIQGDIESLACEVEVLNRAIYTRNSVGVIESQPIETQAKITLLAKIRELKAESNPMEDLEDAVEICLNDDLWDEPARYKHRYQDTERFYDYERICPVNRDGRVEWVVYPDYDPAEDQIFGSDEPNVEQTLFRSFNCCIRCKYISKHPCACAVVPFGCTGDPSEQCREFVSQDSDVHVYLPENPSTEVKQPVGEPIFEQLAQIITALGSPIADAEGGTLYDDGTYIFALERSEVNDQISVDRYADHGPTTHVYRNETLLSHQDIRGVGHNYFFDHTTADDRAYFARLAESLADGAQGAIEPELNPV